MNKTWPKPNLVGEESTMGEWYFSSKHISMPIAKITKSMINVKLNIDGKLL
jgi:hypothetical protein